MSPEQLRDTAMDPATRSLERVLVTDEPETDRTLADLMGKDASARYRFVMERSNEAGTLDV